MPTTQLSLLLLLALAACGVEVAAPADATATVGPEGGHVWSPDGRARLDVPPGALASPIALAIEPIADVPGAIGGTSYELSPSGLEFPVSPLLAIALPPEAAIADAPVSVVKVREDGVVIAQLGENLPGARTATAMLVGFSTYALYPPTSPPLPPAPTRLTATRVAGSTVLEWIAEAPYSHGRWVIERCGPQAAPPVEHDWRPLGTVGMGATGYVDPTATRPDAIYWYRVRGVDGARWGRARTVFVGTFAEQPPRWLELRGALRGDDAALTWDPLALPGVDRFEVAIGADGAPPVVVQTLPNTQSAALVRLPHAHHYAIELRAIRVAGAPTVARVTLVRSGFRLETDARALRAIAGDTVGLVLRVTRAGSFTAPVALSWSADAPAPGIRVAFAPRVSQPDVVDVIVEVDAAAVAGLHPLTLRGEGGGQRAAAAFTLTIEPRVGFDFEVVPGELHVPEGSATASYAISVRRAPGFSERLAFAWVGASPLTDRSSPPGEGGGYLVLGSAPRGRYALTLRGTSEGGVAMDRPLIVWVE